MPPPIAAAGAAAAYRTADALPQAATGGQGFGAALSRAMDEAVQTGHQADSTAARAMTGQASVTEVVLAVSRAELTLQTAVAVRDRVVAAYQDVMRMPI